ncbi:MAG: hypothetical protein JSW17_01790 [Candidatus Omnitrophota bacterium]|nr:MAG: hypothetical protein JSW17_01790 [Candidatus Omnitrophota bacterium]
MAKDKPLVLIMCGGQSLRLWPLSEYKSKNFLDIFGFSPLEVTIKRFLKVTSKDNIYLIANSSEKKILQKLKLIKKNNIFYEPKSKNTAAAILLSLFYLKKKLKQDKTIIVSPIDHLIQNQDRFYAALKTALSVAERDSICTLGIKPTKPTPHFGYIMAGKRVAKGAFSVKRFVEKPRPAVAKKLISTGKASYNSGMFISTLETLDVEFKKHYPFYNNFNSSFRKGSLRALYNKIKDTPFDKAIMEKTRKSTVVKGNFFWCDFGNWNAIYEVLKKDKDGNVKQGKVCVYKGKDNFIHLNDRKKKVLALGVDNIVLVDTPEFALLANRVLLDELKPALKAFKKTF